MLTVFFELVALGSAAGTALDPENQERKDYMKHRKTEKLRELGLRTQGCLDSNPDWAGYPWAC